MGRSVTNRSGVPTLIVLAVLCSVIAFLSYLSSSARTFSAPPAVMALPRMSDACEVWQKSGIRGRVLMLFDRKLNADPDKWWNVTDEHLEITENNYVYIAFRKNLIRTIYHLIPDAAWNDVERNLAGNPYVQTIEGGYRISIEGMPVLIMRIQDVPAIKEPVLVHINEVVWNGAGIAAIIEHLAKVRLRSDLVTVAGDVPPATLEALKTIEEPGR